MRKIIISIFLSVFSLGASAFNIDSLFVSAPDELLPLLERNSRLDLLDLYNSHLEAKVYNDLGGVIRLLEKDSVHFFIQTTNSSYLQFRLLPSAKDTLFSCIRTVLMPEEQSQVLFMDSQWRPLRMAIPNLPDWESFWNPQDSLSDDRVESLRQLLQPASYSAKWETLEDGTLALVYQVSVRGLMDYDRDEALRCLRPIKYVWKKGKFVNL